MNTIELDTEVKTARHVLGQFNKLQNTKWYTDILIEYANKEEINHVVECGVFQGASTAAFMNANIQRLDSYDIDLSLVHRPLFNRIKENIEWSIERKNSLKDLVPECDFLFLDTMHTYEHVIQEINFQGGQARKYIAVHDTNYPPPRKNPKKLVRDAVEEYAAENNLEIAVDFRDHTGIMILSRSSSAG